LGGEEGGCKIEAVAKKKATKKAAASKSAQAVAANGAANALRLSRGPLAPCRNKRNLFPSNWILGAHANRARDGGAAQTDLMLSEVDAWIRREEALECRRLT
jgi:hypothetical protein